MQMKRPASSYRELSLDTSFSVPAPSTRLLPESRAWAAAPPDYPDLPLRSQPKVPAICSLTKPPSFQNNPFQTPFKALSAGKLDISFKSEEGQGAAGLQQALQKEVAEHRQARLELQRAREELRLLAEEKSRLTKSYEEYIEKLLRDNQAFSQKKEGSDSSLSRKLGEIEAQNNRIMENLKSTTATLSENEKSYIQKINSLFSERQALEAQVSLLQTKTQESFLQQSRFEKLKGQFAQAQSDLETERAQRKALQKQLEAARSELEAALLEKQRVEKELSAERGLRDSQLQTLNKRLEQLISMVGSKDLEIGKLKKELSRSNTFLQSNLTLAPSPSHSKLKSEELELLRNKNIELSQKLEDLTKKCESLGQRGAAQGPGQPSAREVASNTLIELPLFSSNPAPNPFICSEISPSMVKDGSELRPFNIAGDAPKQALLCSPAGKALGDSSGILFQTVNRPHNDLISQSNGKDSPYESSAKKPALAAGPSGSHGKPQPCLNSTTNTCLDTNCTADTYPLHGQNSPVMHSKAVSLPASPSYSHARKAHAHFLHQQNPYLYEQFPPTQDRCPPFRPPYKDQSLPKDAFPEQGAQRGFRENAAGNAPSSPYAPADESWQMPASAQPFSEKRTERISRVTVNGKVVFSSDQAGGGEPPVLQSRCRSVSNLVKQELGYSYGGKENAHPNAPSKKAGEGEYPCHSSHFSSHCLSNNSGAVLGNFSGRMVKASKSSQYNEYLNK